MRRATVLPAWVVVAGCLSGSCGNDRQPEPEPEPKKSRAELLEEYRRHAAPGPRHELLRTLAGEWTTSMKAWSHPDLPPVASRGEASGRLLYGGRYVDLETRGKSMGLAFTLRQILGHDNAAQRFELTVLGDTTTALHSAHGPSRDAGRTIRVTGRIVDAVSGAREVTHVFRIESADRFVFESWDTLPDGRRFKVVETVYTRR